MTESEDLKVVYEAQKAQHERAIVALAMVRSGSEMRLLRGNVPFDCGEPQKPGLLDLGTLVLVKAGKELPPVRLMS